MVRAAHSKQSIPLKKGKWIAEEDQKMRRFIQTYGIWNWNKLPKAAGLLRTGKSCRLRWVNYLRPDIKRGNFSEEEVETILKMQEDLGNRWSAIAAKLPGRTDNEIKNFWNSQLRKRLNKRQKTEGVQATEVKKEENVSEGNVLSPSDPKSTCLEGLEETPKSPEAYTPEINFSSDSNSVHEIDETHTMEENIASEKFPGKLEGLPKESPKSPEVYTPVIDVSSDSSSVPKLDRTLTMEENNASKKFAAEPEGPPKETAKSPDVYTLNFSSDSNSVSELDEVHTMEKDNDSEELPAELEGPPKETPKSPDEYTPAINFSSDSNSVSELDEAHDMEEDNASDEFPGELKGFPKEIGMSPAAYTLVINVSSESNCVPKLEEHPTVKNICSQEFPGEPKGLPNETPKSPEVYAPVINFSNDSNSFPKLGESRIKEENNGFEEFAGELKGLPEEPPAMKPMQSLREGKISGNDSGFVSLSSSDSLNEINENQTTEMNSDSPGLYEELQNIWELPYLADNYQGRFKDQFLYDDDLWANPFM